jgi:hypothetical protein
LHSAHQERFATPMESYGSTLFSKTAGCHPSTLQTFKPSNLPTFSYPIELLIASNLLQSRGEP